jgi:hypothetical protein
MLDRRTVACRPFLHRAEVTSSLGMINIAQGLSGAAFAAYGLHCLLSDQMRREFERYGLRRFRVLTGVMQLAGSLGLLLGFALRPLVIPAAAGLALLMLCGVVVRVAIRDPLTAALPALALLFLNTYIAVAATRDFG